MTTGSEFVNITDKAILGHLDMKDRFLEYLKTASELSVKSLWNVDGVFDIKLTLSSPGANQIQVDGASLIVDGIGHLLDVNSIYPSRIASFENANGIDYDVGFHYAERPVGIRINPRTGQPEYVKWREVIGEPAAPSSVVDHGNGTITFNVNSVTESGVDNAGRLVLVYKNEPAEGATSESLAMEELLVAYSGGNNLVTTSGALGQSSPSTTASDYTVILLGVSVKRNISLEGASGFMFVGVVTGNGGTPTAFDNTNQRLLKTFQDSTQVTFTPYGWLTAGTVQGAFEQVVSLLGAEGTGVDDGSNKIGCDDDNWHMYYSADGLDEDGWGGIGALGDSGQPDGWVSGLSNIDLESVMDRIDAVLRQRRQFTGTLGDDTVNSRGDVQRDQPETSVASNGGLWILQKLHTASPSPKSSYRLADGSSGRNPWLIAETSSDHHAGHQRVFRAVTDSDLMLQGRFDRVKICNESTTMTHLLHAVGGLHLNDCGIDCGAIDINGYRAATGNSVTMPTFKRCFCGSVNDAGIGVGYTAADATLRFCNDYSNPNMPPGAVFEDCLIESPNQVTYDHAAVEFDQLTADWTTLWGADDDVYNGSITFRSCVFVQKHPNHTLVKGHSSWGGCQIVFENCVFIGRSDQEATLIDISGMEDVHFRNCSVFAPNGNVLLASAVKRCSIDGMFIYCDDGDGSGTSHQLFTFQGTGTGYSNDCRVSNVVCQIEGSGVFDGTVSVESAITLTSCYVDGFNVQVNAGELPRGNWLNLGYISGCNIRWSAGPSCTGRQADDYDDISLIGAKVSNLQYKVDCATEDAGYASFVCKMGDNSTLLDPQFTLTTQDSVGDGYKATFGFVSSEFATINGGFMHDASTYGKKNFSSDGRYYFEGSEWCAIRNHSIYSEPSYLHGALGCIISFKSSFSSRCVIDGNNIRFPGTRMANSKHVLYAEAASFCSFSNNMMESYTTGATSFGSGILKFDNAISTNGLCQVIANNVKMAGADGYFIDIDSGAFSNGIIKNNVLNHGGTTVNGTPTSSYVSDNINV